MLSRCYTRLYLDDPSGREGRPRSRSVGGYIHVPAGAGPGQRRKQASKVRDACVRPFFEVATLPRGRGCSRSRSVHSSAALPVLPARAASPPRHSRTRQPTNQPRPPA